MNKRGFDLSALHWLIIAGILVILLALAFKKMLSLYG